MGVSRFAFFRESPYAPLMAFMNHALPGPAQGAAPVQSLESAVLAALKTAQRRRPAKTRAQDLIGERTVRMRRKGEPDRRFALAYAIDPGGDGAVIFRVRPVSSRDLGAARAPMLSTQQAADQLNVSRPYVVKLVDGGAFRGVERTQAGHRRIPAAEVERARQEMQTARHAAFNQIETLAADLSRKELDAARAAAKRRWAKTA